MVLTLGLVLGALVLWGAGFLLLWRVPACGPAPATLPTATVIIPARDEAASLPALLASLASQATRPLEVIVADDGSQDATAALAAAGGARVLRVPPRPAGWQGKTWPCWCAAQEARGEVLVFLDADTRLAPDGLGRLLGAVPPGGAASVEPYHQTLRPYEQLSAIFTVIRAASVGAFGLAGRPAGAFGPCLATTRGAYFAAGGHAHPAVRGQILEHFILGRLLLRAGTPLRLLGGRGVISTRMYPGGLGGLVEGWGKAFATGASGTSPRLLALTSAWLSGACSALWLPPVAAVLAGRTGLLLGAALYLACALQLGWMLRQLGGFSRWTSLLFPLPLLAFLIIYARSLYLVRVRRRVRWRGREISVEPESTTPESTTPESTTPESTTPESTTPESTTPESATPESDRDGERLMQGPPRLRGRATRS